MRAAERSQFSPEFFCKWVNLTEQTETGGDSISDVPVRS
jgi:hypothetical protein